jgi:VanZ family protein
MLVGFAFGVAYRHNRRVTALLTVLMTGVIEITQFWAPGRHARLSDFIVDALAACSGLAMAATLDWFFSRNRPQTS